MNDKKIRSTFFCLITLWGINCATISVEAATRVTPDEKKYTIEYEPTIYTIEYEPTIYTVVPEKATDIIVSTHNDNTAAPIKVTISITPEKEPNQQNIYHRTDRYNWKEFNTDGSQFLKEKGSLSVTGVGFNTNINEQSSNKTNLEVYTGDVNYDGATWGGTPILSTTNYKGFKAESVFYNKTGMDNIDMFFGIGYNKWKRDLISTSNSTGYVEKWTIAYTKVGMLQKNNKFSWELGFKYPLYSRNQIDEFGVTLKPKQEMSLFGEVGFQLGENLDLALTYDSMRFTSSDLVYSTLLQTSVFQPKSTADSCGFKIAGKF